MLEDYTKINKKTGKNFSEDCVAINLIVIQGEATKREPDPE